MDISIKMYKSLSCNYLYRNTHHIKEGHQSGEIELVC